MVTHLSLSTIIKIYIGVSRHITMENTKPKLDIKDRK